VLKTKLALCLVAIVMLHSGVHPAAQSTDRYSFVKLLDNTGSIAQIDLEPVISNTGTTAFGATLRDGRRAVFALRDEELTLIGDSSQFPEANPPSISGNGTVVICVREADGPRTRIVAWQPDGQLVEVVNRDEGPFLDLNTLPAIDNRDYVVFWGRLAAGGDVIAGRAIRGGPIEILSTGISGPNATPALNASNTAAFVGFPTLTAESAIVAVNRKGFAILASVAGPFQVFSPAISLNDSGEVAFLADWRYVAVTALAMPCINSLHATRWSTDGVHVGLTVMNAARCSPRLSGRESDLKTRDRHYLADSCCSRIWAQSSPLSFGL
jgi:hypothetical protein